MIIRARFPGVCSECQRPVLEGDRIDWTPGVRAVKHEECTPEHKERSQAVAASKATDATIDVPAPAGREYLPFQRAAIAYAQKRTGVLFADEMGMGKSIEALGVINSDESIRSVLVIAPKSLTVNWRREASRWLTRDLPISHDPKSTTGFVIVGYEQSIGLVESVPHPRPGRKPITVAHPVQELDHPWDAVIVDEVHRCKNPRAQRTQAVSALAARARRRLSLTGSPVPNQPRELWPILAMTDPDNWVKGMGRKRFTRRYGAGYNSSELQERLRATCMVRRLKADVLTELPPKRWQLVELPASEETKDLVAAELSAWESREEAIAALRVRVELSKASDDPADYVQAVAELRTAIRVAFEEMSRIRHSTALAKVPYVVEHARQSLEEDPEGKLIIWAHHRDVIEQLARELRSFGSVFLHGGPAFDRPEARQAVVDRFQDDPSCRVFIGSIKAAGVGYTLTASSHEIFAEIDWVPSEVTQAADRAHRIGQTASSLLIQVLVLEGSLDARIAEVMVAKQEVIDRTLDRAPESTDSTLADRQPVELGAIIPTREQPATSGPRSALDATAATLAPERIALIHEAIQALAGVCDGARSLDGQGFSKIDVEVGKSLAYSARLTPRQAALGLKLVRKYRRQLGGLAAAILGSGDSDSPQPKPKPPARSNVPHSNESVTVTPVVTVEAPEPDLVTATSDAPEAGTDHAPSPVEEQPTMNPAPKAGYSIRILSTDAHVSLVNQYGSWAAVNSALTEAAGKVRGRDSVRVDFAVTDLASGSTYIGRIDLVHPERRGWTRVSLAEHIRTESARLADHYQSVGLVERVPALRAWAARLAPAPKVRRAA